MEFKPLMEPAVPPLFPAHTIDILPRYLTAPFVSIRHPYYPINHKALMEFLAFDNGGIDYDLAYYACCLLVDNAWIREEADRPYFSLIPTPNGRFTRPADGILPANVYYFHDPLYADPTVPYPITPSFAHWSFPHGNLPPPWCNLDIASVPTHKSSSMRAGGREAIISRDECCRMTLALSGVEKAHIVPQAEELWFTQNNMGPYVSASVNSKVNEVKNLILLRADVYKTFNAKALLIVPKLRNRRYVLVTHLLHSIEQTMHELESLYHNRPLHQLYGVSPECLFARFAWTILESTTVQLIDNIRTDPIAIRILENAHNSVNPVSRVVYVTSADQVPPTTSTIPRTTSKRSRSGNNASRMQATEDDSDVEPSTQWDSAVVRSRRRESDSDSDPGTPPLPGSMPGSLGTLPGSSRSNSTAATKVDMTANPKVSGYDSESNQVVPTKRLD
ncbi:hypothetical protein F5Y06DRAFT_305845 [Hypoxylon sp. FL0890]|nr:hypothetical protein F5Y06DRAFT_305845 [Hypoxylon sp. FL0890]